MVEKLLASVRLAFFSPGPPWTPEQVEETRRRITRDVITRTATVNTRLRRGEFVTQEDLDQEFEQLKGLSFSS